MLARSAVTAASVVLVGFVVASVTPAHADPALNGTYRLDFDGAHRTINGVPRPTPNTSATYTFTSSCTDNGCVAYATMLNSTDTEAVSAHNPDLTVQFTDGSWTVSLPYDSPCEGSGERNQLLNWTLTPQPGADTLTGSRIVANVGNSCPGDEPGPLAQPMTATRVGEPAPGILPMPGTPGVLPIRGVPGALPSP